jgi:hypothetical protein
MLIYLPSLNDSFTFFPLNKDNILGFQPFLYNIVCMLVY